MVETNPLRCGVYIDGFNWYYGVFKARPEWKWLDLQRFFKDLRPLEEIAFVKFFTADVTGDSGRRQAVYHRALSTLDKVRIIKGKFQPRIVRCEGRCREQYYIVREKKTDVNIAIHMIEDCMADAFDSLILISGDSDLEPAVAWVRRKKPNVPITVYIPKLAEDTDERRNDFYPSIGVTCEPLPLKRIPTFQLPTAVKVAPGQWVQRPEEWQLQVDP